MPKKLLIIYPHFPPSNLAGVHRPRLFAQHLPSFGWEPVILTVHEQYYEEGLDWNLVKLLPAALRVEKVSAFKSTKPRLIGDIGLRAFFQLYKKAKQLITKENFDFLYIPIPSFYCALLGRLLYQSTKIPYGIDYIDPWVHKFPGSNKILSRHWLSSKLAGLLEPIAIKHARLITGVGEGYYAAVLERNVHLKQQAVYGAMPYGGERTDHKQVFELAIKPYLFSKKKDVLQFVYAGEMLPKAYCVLEAIFKSISENKCVFNDTEFHFIGTGSRVNDPTSYNIKPLAVKYDLWQNVVFEYPQRIPYLDTLTHLNAVDAIFILGSTEAHYTPSKTYQGVLSGKPIMAILHEQSTAVKVVREAGAGLVLDFAGAADVAKIENRFGDFMLSFKKFQKAFSLDAVRQDLFESYSANNVTARLADLLDKAVAFDSSK